MMTMSILSQHQLQQQQQRGQESGWGWVWWMVMMMLRNQSFDLLRRTSQCHRETGHRSSAESIISELKRSVVDLQYFLCQNFTQCVNCIHQHTGRYKYRHELENKQEKSDYNNAKRTTCHTYVGRMHLSCSRFTISVSR